VKVFTEDSPIFQQLADRIADDIVSGGYPEDSAVPSTTEFAVFYRISPATAGKAVNVLVEQEVLYKKRGVGMFVAPGAKALLETRRRLDFHRQYIEPLVREAHILGIATAELHTMLDQEDR
jgi:DNA-binding transcriptional regulator YhcF (GntR family)